MNSATLSNNRSCFSYSVSLDTVDGFVTWRVFNRLGWSNLSPTLEETGRGGALPGALKEEVRRS